MIKLQKKKGKSTKETGAGAKKASSRPPLSDFIPYASLMNPDTILTKNGEVMHILAIDLNRHQLPNEKEGEPYLRDVIRQALGTHVQQDDIAIWVHTVRGRQPLNLKAAHRHPFAQDLHRLWMEDHHWHYTYQNRCYITVLLEGQSAKLWDLADFKHGFSKAKNEQYRSHHLEQLYQQLYLVTNGLIETISPHYHCRRLTLQEKQIDGQPAICSEQLELLHYLLNFDMATLPVTDADIAKQLNSHELIFGYNALEARNADNHRYAAILSIKHYHELPPELLDTFLQLPHEMVVCQAFDYVSDEAALEAYQDVREAFKKSKDEYIAVKSGALDMLTAATGSPTDYIQQQTHITVFSDVFSELEKAVQNVQVTVGKLGLVCVREDIHMEECFWANLPGNFEFLRRQHPTTAAKAAGFARLNYYPIGKESSVWGEPVTVLPTPTKTPYLFHFHEGKNGHTLLLDYNGFPDRIGSHLLHFLLSEASKLTGRIVIFDALQSSLAFARKFGGHYQWLGGNKQSLALNPCQLDDTPQNRGFLGAWICWIMECPDEDVDAKTSVKQIIDHLFTLPAEQRNLHMVASLLEPATPDLASRLEQLLIDPEWASITGSGQDSVDFNHEMSCINLSATLGRDQSGAALFAYLLHRLILTLDDQPTIIVIKEAWKILDHPFFAARLESLLTMLTERNAMLILTTRDPSGASHSNITPLLVEHAATKLYVPDDVERRYLQEVFDLKKSEAEKLSNMERQRGYFLLKHGDEVIPSQCLLENHPELDVALMGDARGYFGVMPDDKDE